jgi:hypothetical protein
LLDALALNPITSQKMLNHELDPLCAGASQNAHD